MAEIGRLNREKERPDSCLSVFSGAQSSSNQGATGPTALNYSLISQQTGEATEAVFPACYCSQSTSLSLSFRRSVTFQTCRVLVVTFYSFSFQTIASRLGLEQYNSSGASAILNAKTEMDIR